jgi:hypothetical protein
MYPCMYPEIANLSGGLEFTETLQSPSGTKIKKGLALQGLFFARKKAPDTPPPCVELPKAAIF